MQKISSQNVKPLDVFTMDVSSQTAEFRPHHSKYTLAQLLKECDLNAPPSNLDAWDTMRPVGQEML